MRLNSLLMLLRTKTLLSSTEYEIKTEIFSEATLETIFDRGSFPRMGFRHVMEGISNLYLLSLHFPSGMFVTISWINYLIPPKAYPGRVGLLLTTFLMLTNKFMGVMQSTLTSGVCCCNNSLLDLQTCNRKTEKRP